MLEIYEMIELIDDFINDNTKSVLAVGGIAGTDIFKMVIDSALGRYDLPEVLMIDGCHDNIGLIKNSVVHYIHYTHLFLDCMVPPLEASSIYVPKILQPKPQFEIRIDPGLLTKYRCIIINNAHLIPTGMLNAIVNNARSFAKVCIVVDPYDINGDNWSVPTVVDSLSKISPMLAMAREWVNVDTRSIEKRIKGSMSEVKINRRSIGKIDDKQYICNDPNILDTVRHKQLQTPFRKNQKVIVTDKRINTTIDKDEERSALFTNAMCVIMSPVSTPMLRLRFYNTNKICYSALSYLDDGLSGTVKVKPANIISAYESSYHKYNTAVVIGVENMSKREVYSIIKNSRNVIIGHLS